MTYTNHQFLVNKSNITEAIFKEETIDDLQEGEVLLSIDYYAFTANNITYAVVGDTIGYWHFFPAPSPYGIIPAWGFATVVASKDDSISKGERYYGYYPMSDYLKVTPIKKSPLGFVDATAHRQELPAIYNFYTNTASDPMYEKAREGFQPILGPLFVTSFLCYYFLKDEAFFGADQVILTSASSKTALALAFMLGQHKKEDGKKIIALTSGKHVDFLEETNFYDKVIAYDQVDEALDKTASVVVDFAGNTDLLVKLYKVLNSELLYTALIGWTDWTAEKEFKALPRAKFFFAPDHIKKRYEEWGVERTNSEMGGFLKQYIAIVSEHIELQHISEKETFLDFYQRMLKGKVDPSKGYLIHL
ncbi:DUF2855 family protein [Sungkyunkwania multivorans]|uniref:DUF2855 family protein n=1 Tax=Sungkyunkwania multivorans TaxID=1173618 RepID=A0ABW3D0P6_9FLAO